MKLVKDTDQIQKKGHQISDEKAKEAIKLIIEWIGENPDREGLKSTPKRVIKAFKEYFQGYNEDPASYLSKTFTEVEGYDDMVIEKNISIKSHCEHHMAPISGVAHVAYIPSKKVVGLSKLARVVETFAKRLQTQERLTMQIANTIMEVLQPRGVAVTIDAAHQCMTTRGVHKQGTATVTSRMLGSFRHDPTTRREFLSIIHAGPIDLSD